MSEGNFIKLVQPMQHQEGSAQLADGQNRAIGAVRIQLQSAHLQKVAPAWLSWLLPEPNPLVEISINGESPVVGRSKQAHRTFDPYWFPQAFHALIHSSRDSIELSVLSNRSTYWRTKLLGRATYVLGRLDSDPFHLAINEKLWKRNKERGSIFFDVVFYKPTHPQGSGDDSTMGIITLIIYEAKDLSSGQISASQLRPGVIVNTEMNGRPGIHATPWGFSGNPKWHSQCEVLALQGKRTRLILEVKDGNVDMGHINLPIGDLLRGEGYNGRWWPLSGSPQGRLRLKAEWIDLSAVHETEEL